MDFQSIAKDVAQCVRGELSTSAVARRLGLRQRHGLPWEAGDRPISWVQFVALCNLADVALDRGLESLSYKGPPEDGGMLISHLIGGATLSAIARKTAISRYALMRWTKGQSRPSLAEVLCVMHGTQFLMFEFLAQLVDLETIPSAASHYKRRQDHKKVYYERPEVAAVLGALKLDTYRKLKRHKPGFVASTIGISKETETELLALLVEAGRLQQRGDGIYEIIDEQVELTDSKAIRAFCSYWLQRASELVTSVDNFVPIINFGMDVYPTSEKTRRRIREEYLQFYRRVRALLAEDEGPTDSVTIFNAIFYSPKDLDKPCNNFWRETKASKLKAAKRSAATPSDSTRSMSNQPLSDQTASKLPVSKETVSSEAASKPPVSKEARSRKTPAKRSTSKQATAADPSAISPC